MRTYSATAADAEASREWYVVDATGQTLGRLATQIASVLKGKHKPIYTPSMDCGDFVIVVNADKIRVTGGKLDDKIYYSYSGYPGGLHEVTLRRQLAMHPDRVIEAAVLGMLSRNKLRRQLIKKLRCMPARNTHTRRSSPSRFRLLSKAWCRGGGFIPALHGPRGER